MRTLGSGITCSLPTMSWASSVVPEPTFCCALHPLLQQVHMQTFRNSYVVTGFVGRAGTHILLRSAPFATIANFQQFLRCHGLHQLCWNQLPAAFCSLCYSRYSRTSCVQYTSMILLCVMSLISCEPTSCCAILPLLQQVLMHSCV